METVEAYVPIFDGLPFPIAEVELQIRPNYDEAFPWDVAADVMYCDPYTKKWHAIPEDRAVKILEDIRQSDRDKWEQIVRAAKMNFAPEFFSRREAPCTFDATAMGLR